MAKGKLTIDGCMTPNQETIEIRKRALPYVVKHKAYEKRVKHVKVRISKGYLFIPEEKYLRNKDHYDNLKN